MSVSDPLTAVILRRQGKFRADRLRFGKHIARRKTARGQTTFWFPPNVIFCLVLWRRNAFGTVSWRLFIARTGVPGDTMSRLPGVQPGARILARFRGVERVRRALRTLRELDESSAPLNEISPAYWLRFHIFVSQKRTLRAPSTGQLLCEKVRRGSVL